MLCLTNVDCVVGPWVANSSELLTYIVYIGCLTVDCLCEHSTDWLAFLTGTLAALTHYLSCFALLVVGIPLR